MFQLVKAEIFRTQETEKTEIDKIHSGGNKMSKEKVVLAYSGGLDTTAIIPWLKETFNYDVLINSSGLYTRNDEVITEFINDIFNI